MNSQEATSTKPSDAQVEAFSYLKEEILAWRFRPLQRLHAGQIAAHLEMSRTPVREALSRLVQDGLVARGDAGGFFVKGLTLREIIDYYRVREALEVEAAIEALPRMDEHDFDNLASILDRAKALLAPASYVEFLSTSRAFHSYIMDASGNVAFRALMGPIIDRVRLVGAMLIARHPRRASEIHKENVKILEALRSADVEALELAVRAHVRQARLHAEKFLSASSSSLVLAAEAMNSATFPPSTGAVHE